MYDYNVKEEKIAGTIGTVGTVAGVGAATAGFSAAAMTTGLASVGALVGSGMAACLAAVAAAPLVIGAAAIAQSSLPSGGSKTAQPGEEVSMRTRSETYLAHQILTLVASHYEISLKELLCGKSYNARLARGSAIYAIRKHTSLPLTSVAALLGYDTPEVVLYSLRLHEVDMRSNPQLQKVQHLVEHFVSAAIDLQMPSKTEKVTDVPSRTITDILADFV